MALQETETQRTETYTCVEYQEESRPEEHAFCGAAVCAGQEAVTQAGWDRTGHNMCHTHAPG